MPHMTQARRLRGRSELDAIGVYRPLVVGRERVCPTCQLAFWIASGHDCDRKPAPRPLTWAERKYGTDWDGYCDAVFDNHDH